MNYSYFAGYDQDPYRGSASNPDDLMGSIPQANKVMMADCFFRWNNPGSAGGGIGPLWSFNHGVNGAVAQYFNGPYVTGTPKITGNNVLYGDYSVSFKTYSNLPAYDSPTPSVPHVSAGGNDQAFY